MSALRSLTQLISNTSINILPQHSYYHEKLKFSFCVILINKLIKDCHSGEITKPHSNPPQGEGESNQSFSPSPWGGP